jgi:hypothetical protein
MISSFKMLPELTPPLEIATGTLVGVIRRGGYMLKRGHMAILHQTLAQYDVLHKIALAVVR